MRNARAEYVWVVWACCQWSLENVPFFLIVRPSLSLSISEASLWICPSSSQVLFFFTSKYFLISLFYSGEISCIKAKILMILFPFFISYFFVVVECSPSFILEIFCSPIPYRIINLIHQTQSLLPVFLLAFLV